ncbi:MAG: HNH endonuclease signature motif containing protein [Dehalogenimonas sp.]
MSAIQHKMFGFIDWGEIYKGLNFEGGGWRWICSKVRFSGNCPQGLKDISNIKPKLRCQSPCKELPEYKITYNDYKWTYLETRDLVISLYDGKCAICGDTTSIEVHHKTPRYLGGKDTYDNLIPLCWKCHQLAPDSPEEFEVYKERAKAMGGFKHLFKPNYENTFKEACQNDPNIREAIEAFNRYCAETPDY